MADTLVIYHKGCMDGFASACVVASYLQSNPQCTTAEYRAMTYADVLPIEDVYDRDVYIVDFSFEPLVMAGIAEHCNELTWADHHVSAADSVDALMHHTNASVTFDPRHCGAVLTWYALGGTPKTTPSVLRFVEDRDLWKWELGGSKAVSAALKMRWMPHFDNPAANYPAFLSQRPTELVGPGESLLEWEEHCAAHIATRARFCTILDNDISYVVTDHLHSEVGHLLCQDGKLGVTCYLTRDGSWKHSVRSRDGRAGPFATAMGGGGHPNAGGWRDTQPVWTR